MVCVIQCHKHLAFSKLLHDPKRGKNFNLRTRVHVLCPLSWSILIGRCSTARV